MNLNHEFLNVLAVVLLYFVVVRWVLPKFGVAT